MVMEEQFITSSQLRSLVPGLSDAVATQRAAYYNNAAPAYGMDDHAYFAAFIAQIIHESNGFKSKEENLNYSWQRLRQVFPRYFPNDTIAQSYDRKPIEIANRVYANRMGNGDEKSGDGWMFRGGGDIQLTGRSTWAAYAAYLSKPLEEVLTLVRTTDEFAIDSSLWFFCVHRSLKNLCGNFLALTKAINGGTNGYADREKHYLAAKKIFF